MPSHWLPTKPPPDPAPEQYGKVAALINRLRQQYRDLAVEAAPISECVPAVLARIEEVEASLQRLTWAVQRAQAGEPQNGWAFLHEADQPAAHS